MMIMFAAAPAWLTTWTTSLWLVGVGALVGLTVLLLLWGLLRLVRPAAAGEVSVTLSEGVLLPITFVLAGMASFGLLGSLFVREPVTMLRSLPRLSSSGQREVRTVIPVQATAGAAATGEPVRVDFRGDELRELEISADQYVTVADAATEAELRGEPIEIGLGDGYDWFKSRQGGVPFGGDRIENFYIRNTSDSPANVTIRLATAPAYPQVGVIPVTAIAAVGLFLLYFLQAWCFPRVSAVALATTKSEIAQPLFGILLALGIFLILFFQFLPYNTFGEDIKMLKDSGLTLVMLLAIIQGVWGASNSVSEEIEGRTALTVLSKPISRRQFILGKLLGIIWTVALMFIVLGVVLLVVVAYKPVYDARELGAETPDWDIVHTEVVRTVPGLVLAFFETVVLVSVSVAISTRLPLLANFVICFSIYVLGHLTPLLVQSRIQLAPVVFIGQLIATILPVLDHFNIQAAVAAGVEVPFVYLAWAFVYCLLYSSIAILLALASFEDRDLA